MTEPLQTQCSLSLHGAAANSCPHSICWVPCPRRAAVTTSHVDDLPLAADTKENVLIYASSGVVNLATTIYSSSIPLTTVTRTLITRTERANFAQGEKKILARGEAVEDAAAFRSIRAISWVDPSALSATDASSNFGFVAAFSDGTVTSWRWVLDTVVDGIDKYDWMEFVLIGNDPSSSSPCLDSADIPSSILQESIADVSAICLNESTWLVGTASSVGILLCVSYVPMSSTVNDSDASGDDEGKQRVLLRQVCNHSSTSIHIAHHTSVECFVFAGSASPRHNKVWVYTVSYSVLNGTNPESIQSSCWAVLPTLTVESPRCHGFLLGHQDWVTCFAWSHEKSINGNEGESEALLASSGHDAKIRLWRFSSFTTSDTSNRMHSNAVSNDDESSESSGSNSMDEDEDEVNIDVLEEENGEARLVIHHSATSVYSTTAVSLEALLLGHEEAITSLTWRNNTNQASKPCLLSSSMDRTILLWMEEAYEENNVTSRVWVPISRVGSAGGILGGSVGASLMGFVDATFSPDAKRIVGHGYGGSLHFWSEVADDVDAHDDEDPMLRVRWMADPCITGHFRSVQDLAWDSDGEFLLTVGSDQTTRLWAEVPTNVSSCRWMEVGRPQVHGYDMTSIVCVGGDDEPRYRFVSGADEKVLRVFDAPLSTLRLLHTLKQLRFPTVDESFDEKDDAANRVERAFMPSLGLSNKATADTEQENTKFAGPTNEDAFVECLDVSTRSQLLKLPSERDLGVTTLWPETRKLYGHESELVCLDAYRSSIGSNDSTLVASSSKARNDISSAAIRLWNVREGMCVGVLKGGHRSTVSTLSFSCNGEYLASSGKDRRICIWRKQSREDKFPSYELAAAVDSAHKRIVWSLHFCPLHPNIFASGSRDGFIKVWRVSESSDVPEMEIDELTSFEPTSKSAKKSEPVTALSFAPILLSSTMIGINFALLAVGTESGRIEVWKVPLCSERDTPSITIEAFTPTFIYSVCGNDSHFVTVNKLAWRPRAEGIEQIVPRETSTVELSLASCGEDCGVRILDFRIRCRVNHAH